MRIEKEKVVIPEKIIEQEVYICETCGTKRNTNQTFRKCEVCGKEICYDCTSHTYLYDAPLLTEDNMFEIRLIGSDDYGTIGLDSPHFLCKDCASKLKIKDYTNNIRLLIDNFNNTLSALNQKYIKGELSET